MGAIKNGLWAGGIVICEGVKIIKKGNRRPLSPLKEPPALWVTEATLIGKHAVRFLFAKVSFENLIGQARCLTGGLIR